MRRKEEEERLEAERLQQEEEERRRREEEELRQEEKRRLEEDRRIQEEQRRVQEEERRRAEEERLRAEEEEARRLAEDEDEVEEDDYENDIVTKLNQSILEDATETTAENNVSVYDMTMEKIYKPATADNYNIEDLSSGDETDDETAPRKKVPSWAEWPSLNKMGIEQAKVKHDFTDMYGTMENPDSQGIFKPSKKPRRQRGSSAQWSSPASNPTKGKSRFLAQQQQ